MVVDVVQNTLARFHLTNGDFVLRYLVPACPNLSPILINTADNTVIKVSIHPAVRGADVRDDVRLHTETTSHVTSNMNFVHISEHPHSLYLEIFIKLPANSTYPLPRLRSILAVQQSSSPVSCTNLHSAIKILNSVKFLLLCILLVYITAVKTTIVASLKIARYILYGIHH